MVQSVLQGTWYGDPNHVQTHEKINTDFLARHLRTVRDYSRVVKSIKPAKQPQPHALQRFSTPPVPDNCVIEMPTTAGEVGEFYGQAGEEATKGMADYLTNAPDFALRRYLRTVRGSPTSRAHWAHPPARNNASLQQTMPHRVHTGGSQPVARPRTASSVGSRARTPHQEMLRQVRCLNARLKMLGQARCTNIEFNPEP